MESIHSIGSIFSIVFILAGSIDSIGSMGSILADRLNRLYRLYRLFRLQYIDFIGFNIVSNELYRLSFYWVFILTVYTIAYFSFIIRILKSQIKPKYANYVKN